MEEGRGYGVDTGKSSLAATTGVGVGDGVEIAERPPSDGVVELSAGGLSLPLLDPEDAVAFGSNNGISTWKSVKPKLLIKSATTNQRARKLRLPMKT